MDFKILCSKTHVLFLVSHRLGEALHTCTGACFCSSLVDSSPAGQCAGFSCVRRLLPQPCTHSLGTHPGCLDSGTPSSIGLMFVPWLISCWLSKACSPPVPLSFCFVSSHHCSSTGSFFCVTFVFPIRLRAKTQHLEK